MNQAKIICSLFLVLCLSTALASGPAEMSIFIGEKARDKVDCSHMGTRNKTVTFGTVVDVTYYDLYSCDNRVFVRMRKDSGFSFDGPITTLEVVDGKIRFAEINKYEVNDRLVELKSFASSNFGGFEEPKKELVNDEEKLNDSAGSRLYEIDWMRKNLLEVDSPELKDTLNIVQKSEDTLLDSFMYKQLKTINSDDEVTCPKSPYKNKACLVSLCENTNKSSTNKTYLIRQFDESSPFGLNANFYQFTINERGELVRQGHLPNFTAEGVELPFWHVMNNSSFSTNGKIPDYPVTLDSIITSKMTIPEEFQEAPEDFKHLLNSPQANYLKMAVEACPEDIKELYAGAVDKTTEKFSQLEMIQVIELLNDGLISHFVNEDLMPDGTCNGDGYYYEEEAHKEIERYSPNSEKTPVTLDKAKELFEEQKQRLDIAWDYTADGCYARAHLMTRDFFKEGIFSDKVWARGDFSINADNGQEINWMYHVAPVLSVIDEDGEITKMVIDPSVNDGPVSISQWLEKFDQNTQKSRQAQETVFPMPEDSISYGRTVYSISNMIPFNPSQNKNMSEADKRDVANSTMQKYLKK